MLYWFLVVLYIGGMLVFTKSVDFYYKILNEDCRTEHLENVIYILLIFFTPIVNLVTGISFLIKDGYFKKYSFRITK